MGSHAPFFFSTIFSLPGTGLILAALPIMMVYPFLQKYFAKGLTVGSVKG